MDKKFVMGIAAMAALTLVSCSSDDLDSFSDNSSKNEAISFDGYLGRSAVAVNGSRGSVLEMDDLKKSTDGFGVFGKHTLNADPQPADPMIFKNQQVTYKYSKWTYSPIKYWPTTDGHIDFLAYAPYDKNTTLTENSKINFTVNDVVAKQKDLLWANAKAETNAAITSTNNKVTFHFAHALSKLGYTIKLHDKYTTATFKLDKITLAGSPDETTKKAFYKTGTIDLSKDLSKNPSDNKVLWTVATSDGNKQNLDWVTEAESYEVNSTDPNASKNYLFVIPQDFSKDKTAGGSDVDELYIIVQYTITYTNGDTQTNTVYKQLKQNFLQGKAYKINLTIGLPIEFDADVTPWETEIGIPEDGDDSWGGIK